jgi:integrase
MAMRERLLRGSILKKHGSWHWRYYEAGKQRSVKLAEVSDECRTQQDVIKLANEAAKHIGNVDQPRTSNVAIVSFVEQDYLPWLKDEKRPTYLKGVKQIWGQHLKKHFGDRALREYQPVHATEFLSSLAPKYSRNTISHIRAAMSAIFAYAVGTGRLAMNPIHNAILLRKPKTPKPTAHYTPEEMGAILHALQNHVTPRAIMALAFVGLDRSEIRGLKREDVDLAAGVVHVRRGVTGTGKLGTKDIHEGAKTQNRARAVTIGPVVVDILRSHIESNTEGVNGWLFENEAGNALELGLYATRVIRKRLEGTDCVWKGYHAGRRGAETEMCRATNGNSQTTMLHFGHTKAVADAHYVKAIPEETVKAALALDGAISRAIEQSEKQVTVQ